MKCSSLTKRAVTGSYVLSLEPQFSRFFHFTTMDTHLHSSLIQLLGRFVTRQELEGLGLSHLVGSSLLRAYMHGYFIHNKLWQKAKAIAAPVDYASVRKERIQSKLEAERAQRITLKRRLPKVGHRLLSPAPSSNHLLSGHCVTVRILLWCRGFTSCPPTCGFPAW